MEVKTRDMNLTMWAWPGNDWILTSEGHSSPGLQKVQGDIDNFKDDIYFYIWTKAFHTREKMQ